MQQLLVEFVDAEDQISAFARHVAGEGLESVFTDFKNIADLID